MITTFRTARASDLPAIRDVFFENEFRNSLNPPPHSEISPELRHIFETGVLHVAEQNGRIIGYSGSIARGQINYLTDLFVLPELQSGGLGKTLLEHALPPDQQYRRCTISSSDPRAQALYIRAGLHPQWPHFNLLLKEAHPQHLPATDVETIEGERGDPAFVRWDEQIGGRARPVEHDYWVRMEQAVPLWFRHQGVLVGYGYVRPGAMSLSYPGAWAIGPIGTTAPEHAEACVLAAVTWAQQRTKVLRIDVPGPHPALASLLNIGFKIIYVEIFLGEMPFFDARCYIASDSTLL